MSIDLYIIGLTRPAFESLDLTQMGGGRSSHLATPSGILSHGAMLPGAGAGGVSGDDHEGRE